MYCTYCTHTVYSTVVCNKKKNILERVNYLLVYWSEYTYKYSRRLKAEPCTSTRM